MASWDGAAVLRLIKSKGVVMTRKSLKPIIFAFCLLMLLLTGSYQAPQALAASGPNTIAYARTLPLDTLVAVSGTVSTSSGAFESSFFDKGFGLQDESAGIYVSTQFDSGAKPGQIAMVTGLLQESYGLLILVPAKSTDVVIRGRGERIHPFFVATADVGEGTEGKIVRVVGRITEPVIADPPYGYKCAIDDGTGPIQIFINQQTGIDPNPIQLGETASITGFSSQFDTHYEIDPRTPKDIKVRAH